MEVVVALTATAMLLVVVYNSIHLGIHAHRAVASTVHDNDETRAFTYFLRRQFRHVTTAVTNNALRFSGDRYTIRSALQGYRGDPSVHLLRLESLPGNRPRRLVATIQRVDPDSSQAPSSVLRSEIRTAQHGVDFSFYGAPEPGQAPAWHDRWQPGDHPPRLVRLRYMQGLHGARTIYLPVAGADGNQVARYVTGGPRP